MDSSISGVRPSCGGIRELENMRICNKRKHTPVLLIGGSLQVSCPKQEHQPIFGLCFVGVVWVSAVLATVRMAYTSIVIDFVNIKFHRCRKSNSKRKQSFNPTLMVCDVDTTSCTVRAVFCVLVTMTEAFVWWQNMASLDRPEDRHRKRRSCSKNGTLISFTQSSKSWKKA